MLTLHTYSSLLPCALGEKVWERLTSADAEEAASGGAASDAGLRAAAAGGNTHSVFVSLLAKLSSCWWWWCCLSVDAALPDSRCCSLSARSTSL